MTSRDGDLSTAGLVGHTPASTRRSSNAGLMLAHRLRRWPSIKPALD